ncbi:CoA ester lyase, partial [Novosphingobium sp.]|uniref:HpcH/HpaI aldolase/citrate lyase family protein n=1 Tax=Novosphingobium sp. TaxID=1874826 RepID=UPI0025F4B5D3
MAMRSWLFVPADSEKKLGKAPSAGADVLIVDLEDSVVPDNKALARVMACKWLQAHRTQITGGRAFGRWVRINALDTPYWREDLHAVLPGAPDGIMLPKSAGPEAVQQLAAELYELEGRSGVPAGSTRILPLVSETAAAALTIPTYATASLPRLAGLTWGAEDLSAAIGASRKRDKSGQWTDVFRFVRSQTVLSAHARGVAAIDTLYADFADGEGLKAAADAARADGFAGMLAIHPAQVPIINQAFTPTAAEIEEAQAIVAAFAANPAAGALQ